MIKLFRKIRQKLLQNGKLKSYAAYAIGEIFLVMIGILLALQINNWNENRKTNSKIKSALIDLRSDLAQDTLLILERLPEVNNQLILTNSLRSRIAKQGATIDTLIKIVRHEFNPNWANPIHYNTIAFESLNSTGLMENLSDSLKFIIKNFYNNKFDQIGSIDRTTINYREKVSNFVDTYAFGSTDLHDQGPLIDSLIWKDIDLRDLAAKFQGISNFKRILFSLSKNEMEFSLIYSRDIIFTIEDYLKEIQ